MHILRKILRPLTDLIRCILSKPDERGDLTSDLLRLTIRKKARQLICNNNGLLLDVGCGKGLLYENLLTKQSLLKVVGIDTDHEMLRIANEEFRNRKSDSVHFVRTLVQNLPFRDKSIDIAICINTFYNFYTKDEVVKALEEMERVCKQGGFIIFDVRNKLNPFVYLGFKWVRLYDTHVTLNAYSLKELTTVLCSKGLVIKKTVPIGFPIKMLAPIILVKMGHQ